MYLSKSQPKPISYRKASLSHTTVTSQLLFTKPINIYCSIFPQSSSLLDLSVSTDHLMNLHHQLHQLVLVLVPNSINKSAWRSLESTYYENWDEVKKLLCHLDIGNLHWSKILSAMVPFKILSKISDYGVCK